MHVAPLTSDFLQIDVRRWQRDGLLQEGTSFAWQWSGGGVARASITVAVEQGSVVLRYRYRYGQSSEWTEASYPVRLEQTPCHLGGSRPWFLCPTPNCGRRVAILYCGALFACRHCYGLAYPTTRESAASRAMRRANAFRGRLGWPLGVLRPTGGRPKWMRRKTFRLLLWQHNDAREKALAPIRKALGWEC